MTTGNESTLERLKQGIRRFQTEVYAPRREQYQVAATTQQQPHTLLITCADSRIDPEALTQSPPGEIFVTRNIGNMVPAYGEMVGGVSAVIEYAVDALRVNQVVICGHTDCGAMKALTQDDSHLESMPTVRRWLRNAEAAKRVSATMQDGRPLLDNLTEQNVLLQMTHLRTHPSVAGAIAQNRLSVSGWVYDLFHGDVRIFDESSNTFQPVRQDAPESAS